MSVISIVYTMEDSDGDHSNFAIRVPRGTLTLAQLQTFVDLVTADLWLVVDGVISAISVQVPLTVNSTGSHTAEANVEVEVGAAFSLSNSAGVRDTLYIPTFSKNKISGGVVDLTDSDVLAFLAHIISGDTPVFPCDANELDITAVPRAFETTRKRKR